MKNTVIIVAGGSGKRMKTSFPKQFLILNKLPILVHTINAFVNFDKKINIILVLPEGHIKLWENMCVKYHFKIPHKIIIGGTERFYSVKNALDSIEEETIVAIHDGVRPLVSEETIKNTFEMAKKEGNAVPFTDMVESIRFIDGQNNKAVERNLYKAIQTPQVFNSKMIKEAYNQDFSDTFTDDASVLEALGEKIFLTIGNIDNIKITTPKDLKFAEVILQSNFSG